ncbi:MAG: hypothetical protein K2M12_09430 [Muribaculaceae bacterium]|nr:hypothetical protein [Muribaculaceae bacterium]
MIKPVIMCAAVIALSSCSPKATTAPAATATENIGEPVAAPVVLTGTGSISKVLPKALVYRTNVPCPDKVVISLNTNRTAVQSFPAPTDVSAASAPLPLGHGWWLDRRGMGPNPAFIDMTYEQYAALKQAPSPAELLKMVLPDVHVTEARRLDMTPAQAAADTAAVLRLLDL